MSLSGPAALASFGGGIAELGARAEASGTRHSWIGEVASAAMGYGLIAIGALSLLFVLAVVVSWEPMPNGVQSSTRGLPVARAHDRHGAERRMGRDHWFPSWFAPVLVAAAAMGVDRVAAHVS